jgi:hypothetical protein
VNGTNVLARTGDYLFQGKVTFGRFAMKKIFAVFLLLLSQILFGQTSAAPVVGDGSVATPYQIASLENLYWIAENSSRWAAAYEQTADIDASATSSWFSGAGWIPIGNGTAQFTGQYDGKGHTISSLFVNRTSGIHVGLFGYTNRAAITNLGVINANITGTGIAGALIGYKLYGSVTSCFSSGTITVSPDYDPAGGLVGQNGRPYPYSYPSTISDSYSSATVNGNRYAGGFVGYNEHVIDRCYSTGNVTGTNNVGGFVGNHSGGEIRDCYSRGNVNGTYDAGGFFGTINISTYCYRCYSTGSVTGTAGIGGFGGSGGGGTAFNSVWDMTSSGKPTSSFATGKTTTQMKLLTTFTDAGWDFEDETTNGTANYWDMDLSGTVNDGYPFLSWQNGTAVSLPVELSMLTATASNGAVNIRWRTETEINNHGFEVERLINSHIPKFQNPTWKKIGFVEGNGTSSISHEYSFTDHSASAGTYLFRLKQIDREGSVHYSESVEAKIENVPNEFVLENNFPNPFNPSTTIRFGVPEASSVRLEVYDLLGRRVAELVNGTMDAGYREVIWNAAVSSGVYVYRIESVPLENANNRFVRLKKMLLVQ